MNAQMLRAGSGAAAVPSRPTAAPVMHARIHATSSSGRGVSCRNSLSSSQGSIPILGQSSMPRLAPSASGLLLPNGSRYSSSPDSRPPQQQLLQPQLQLPPSPRDVSAHAVSVPKVLVRPPGERQMQWVELWESYTYQKVIFIKSAITEDVANNLIALTLHLDSLDKKRIYYWMNCPGGEVVPTLALYDTMQYVRSKTATVCYGLCLGMGGFLLTAGGEKGYRFAMPHSILMMHHPSGSSRGQASEMHIESRELVRVRDYLSLLTANATGQPYDRVIRELSRNKWMDPKQAIEYGMIDKVLTTSKPKMPSEGPTFNFKRAAEAAKEEGLGMGVGMASTDGDAGL